MSNGIKDLLQRVKDAPRPTQQVQAMGIAPQLNIGVPLAIKSIVSDVIGKQVRERLGLETLGSIIGERPISEHSMNRWELRAMQDAAIRAMGGSLRDKGHIGYEDWETTHPDNPYADVGGTGGGVSHGESSGIIRKLLSPSYNAKATLGQAMVERDPDTGEYYIIDQYNFNERKPEPTSFDEFKAILARRLDPVRQGGEGQGAYGVVRSFGEAYGSPEGEGSLSRINLGNLEDALARSQEEDKPGLLTRGLAYLGNLLKRDREPSPVLAGPSVADGTSVPSDPDADRDPIELLRDKLQPIVSPSITLDDFNFDR
jgi:hypothetical protein